MGILVLGGVFENVEAEIKLRKYGYKVTLISDRAYKSMDAFFERYHVTTHFGKKN